MAARSLYECSNARVKGQRIYCAKGHFLSTAEHSKRARGTIPLSRLTQGEPLQLKVCQACPDFESMGDPIPPEERGLVE